MLLPCLPLAQLLSQVKNKYDKDEVLIFAELTFFGGQSRGSAEWKKKMCLVLETLINLLLLNSNNLTYWSRECPVCFPWGSVSFSAGADDVMRDGGRGGRWKENIRCNPAFSLRGHERGNPKASRRTATPSNTGRSIMWGHRVRVSRLWLESGFNSPGEPFLRA